MKNLLYLFAIILLTSCTNVGVGGSVGGGSNSGVHVGAGVGIHLLQEDASHQ